MKLGIIGTERFLEKDLEEMSENKKREKLIKFMLA